MATSKEVAMNTFRELDRSGGGEDSHKVFYCYENVVTKILPDGERPEKIMVCNSRAEFVFLNCFNSDNATTEDA